ncbi:MAG: hypothetical protein ACE5H9_12455 [Anaerolineae bacterium]
MAYIIQQPVQKEASRWLPLAPSRKAKSLSIKWIERGEHAAIPSQSALFEIVCDSHNYPTYLPCTNMDCPRGGFPIGPYIAKILSEGATHHTDSLICCNVDTLKMGCNHSIDFVVQVNQTP